MPNYSVTWQYECDAESPVEAAQKALEVIRDTQAPSNVVLDVIDREPATDLRTSVGIVHPRLRPSIKTMPTLVEYLKPVEAQLFRFILEDRFRWLDGWMNTKPGDSVPDLSDEAVQEKIFTTVTGLHGDLKSRASKKAEVKNA